MGVGGREVERDARAAKGAAATHEAGKVYIAGEYEWTTGDVPGFMGAILASTASLDCYWSLFPHADDHGFVAHGDGLTLHWPGDNASMTAFAAVARGHALNMSGAPGGPGVPPLVPPLVTIADAGTGAVAWRGAAGGALYSVEVAPSAAGPFAVACDRCASDNQTPLVVKGAAAAGSWVRVRAFNTDGVAGPYSAPAEVQ